MYDGVTPSHLPNDGDIYAGYMNGHYSNMALMEQLHPGKIYVDITVDPSALAHVYDCEPGNGDASDAIGWVLKERSHGFDPTIYCGLNTWYPTIHQSFLNAGVEEPWYWVADGTKQAIPVNVNTRIVALQYRLDVPPGYDQSIVSNFWPGIDNSPSTQGTGNPITEGDEMTPYQANMLQQIYDGLYKGGGSTPGGKPLMDVIGQLVQDEATHYLDVDSRVQSIQTKLGI